MPHLAHSNVATCRPGTDLRLYDLSCTVSLMAFQTVHVGILFTRFDLPSGDVVTFKSHFMAMAKLLQNLHLLVVCIPSIGLIIVVSALCLYRPPIIGGVGGLVQQDSLRTTLVSDYNSQHRLVPAHLVALPRNRLYARLPFVSVVVVVTSAAGWVDRRQRIRHQFPRNLRLVLSSEENSVVLKFAIGTEGVRKDVIDMVKLEAGNFSDILFFECVDEDGDLKHPHLWRRDAGVSSTTSKVLLSVQWAVQHYDFQYFFRLGDDSYFRIDKFLSMLSNREIPTLNAVVGHIMRDRVFDMEQLYPQGMGYGLTYDVCTFIAANSGVLMNTAPEDCVVARWLFALGSDFVDSARWLDIHMGDKCHIDMVLAHKLPAELWESIADNGTVVC